MAINHNKNMLFAGILGAVIFTGVGYLLAGTSDKDQSILALEDKIKNLEASLAQKDENLKNLRNLALRQQGKGTLVAANDTATQTGMQVSQGNQEAFQSIDNAQTFVSQAPSSTQIMKDLGTNSVNDPRSFMEKANDLLSVDPSQENAAIVSKSIFDLANNREILPDYMLQSMYTNQTDPDLKRVIAQVLSNRGNNALIENQITEAQSRLKSANPSERQSALTNLAKTHSSNAADAIAPLLNDPNIDVKLDALLALRATGNQTHISFVENLVNDPDPAVSSLAKEVVGDLRNLSDSARTMLSVADIASELPMIQTP